jgi:hypothetical protein
MTALGRGKCKDAVMRVSAISVQGAAGWPGVGLETHGHGLTAICGPANSGKSTVAGLLGHVLFGKGDAQFAGTTLPEGDVLVEGLGGRYRLRRVRDGIISRLTVAALDGAPADHQTTQRLVGGLSPSVLSPLCAVSFRESPNVGHLLSKEFAVGFQSIHEDGGPHVSRRAAELAARRDLLAQELETRISGERRASGELETRWRELDRQARDQQQIVATLEQRLQSCEKSLAETDARLRYRRLELNVELRWRADENVEPEASPLADLDGQIESCRQSLAGLAGRESVVRGRIAQVQTARTGTANIADQQTWLAVSRQLAADLSGEVARLARASSSQSCVCQDAHPRLRPIAETIERQLAVLEECIQDQRRALSATELQGELDGLIRMQAETRRHLEQLLARRQAHTWGARSSHEDTNGNKLGFSAADAELLERRRLELEQERFQLVEQVNTATKKLKTLRSERDAIERQRASLLSARSIEHVQRELAEVQHKLEQAAGGSISFDAGAAGGDYPARASDFLAQLTGGDLVRVALIGEGRRACVNREGTTIPVEHLGGSHRDQVYLSLCLSMLSAAARKGVWLPLVLDEPFERLDARGTAALVAVLDVFCRQGHQVFVFTRKQDATERLTSAGAALHNIASLRRWQNELPTFAPHPVEPPRLPVPVAIRPMPKKPKVEEPAETADVPSTEYSVQSTKPVRRRKKKPADRSDAA